MMNMTNETDDVKIVGRSGIPQPTEMTLQEIKAKFGYAQHRSWARDTLYYNPANSWLQGEYLAFMHNPTGIIFAYHSSRHGSDSVSTYKLDGTMSSDAVFTVSTGKPSFGRMTQKMDEVDSDRMNWDVVRVTPKPILANCYTSLYIFDGSSRYYMGDLSMIFNKVDVLQKGCKDIKSSYSIEGKHTKLEKTNEIEELIV
tara:strand:+ start:6707 stop:7303 length:597 start_codon:yes stop_codon:yes gene_type:complete